MVWLESPFGGDADRAEIIALLGAGLRDDPSAGYLHPGDVCWRLVQLMPPDPEDADRRKAAYHGTPAEQIALWRDEPGVLAGYSSFSPTNELEWQLCPELRGNVTLLAKIIDWGETKRADYQATSQRANGASDVSPEPLLLSIYDGDAATVAALTGMGWAKAPETDDMFRFERDLTSEPILSASPPNGFTVRAVGGPEEYAARIALHRHVWAPSAFNAGRYAAVRAAPVYHPDLDLVVAGSDGRLAAYCTIWYDPISRTGEFEPVGTHEEFRGRGIGRALISEGQRRLQAMGARTAIVYTDEPRKPAVALYRSAGFASVGRYEFWGR